MYVESTGDGLDYVEGKGFYPSFTFNLYGDKLVSVDIEFNHFGTIRSNESPMLYPEEKDEVMQEVVKYFNEYSIDATFEFAPFSDEYTEVSEGYLMIVGKLSIE